jgi:putative ABC transport system permease protein
MGALRGWLSRVAGFSRRRRISDWELGQEFQAHLQMQIEDNLRAGMSPEEARRAALIKAGNIHSAREQYRDQRGLPLLETLLQDVRYGARMLRKSPGFTFVAVLTLALGIGANTAIFSIINAVLLRPLPFYAQDRLVGLWETENAPGNYPFAGPDYMDWQAQTKTLEGTSAYGYRSSMNASTGGEAESVTAIHTQANFFSLLGVQPHLGRAFLSGENDPGKNHVVLLSYAYWQKSFGGKPDVLSRRIQLDGEPYQVIGVLPSWFNFPTRVDLFVPMDMSTKGMLNRGTHWFKAIGRLKKGETVASAQAELSTIAKNLEKQYPDTNQKVGASVVALREQITRSSRVELLVLLAAVGLVLMIACFNVANLLLARATGRLREIALRAVLGASRWRIVRQLLTESVLLAAMGAALGLAGAWWCIDLVRDADVLPVPRTNVIQVDLTVLLFTVVVSVAVGVLFGLAPALQASGVDLSEELKSAAQSVLSPAGWQRWVRSGLVVAEIALSLALLAGAGLLLRTFEKLRTKDIGVDSRQVMTAAMLLPPGRYNDFDSQRGFFEQLEQRIQSIAGVHSVSISTEIPLEGGNNGYIKADGDTDPSHLDLLVGNTYVTPGYFSTLGIPVLAGRTFTQAEMDRAADVVQKLIALSKKDPDIKNPPEFSFDAVISKDMASTFWPNQNPIGRTFRYRGDTNIFRVIGVVGDVNMESPKGKPGPQAYIPFTCTLGNSRAYGNLIIKSTLSWPAILSGIRRSMRQLDPSLALFQPRTMQQVIDDSMQDTQLDTWLFGSFAGLALLLAGVGLYSVLSYLVTQRTREIGIRMALGAEHSDILRLVMRHAGALIGTGTALGILLAFAGTRLMASLLYGVAPRDPLTFGGVVLVLVSIALVACYVPARRAMRVDPMVALRYE